MESDSWVFKASEDDLGIGVRFNGSEPTRLNIHFKENRIFGVRAPYVSYFGSKYLVFLSLTVYTFG